MRRSIQLLYLNQHFLQSDILYKAAKNLWFNGRHVGKVHVFPNSMIRSIEKYDRFIGFLRVTFYSLGRDYMSLKAVDEP